MVVRMLQCAPYIKNICQNIHTWREEDVPQSVPTEGVEKGSPCSNAHTIQCPHHHHHNHHVHCHDTTTIVVGVESPQVPVAVKDTVVYMSDSSSSAPATTICSPSSSNSSCSGVKPSSCRVATIERTKREHRKKKDKHTDETPTKEG